MLFIDEAAHIENWEDFFTSVYPTISAGKETKIILVSTPNGLNYFWKFWKEANEGKNGYHPIFVTWKDVPGRDEKWYKETMEGLSGDQ
jgi:phage FluMu gp28-like protein